MIKFTRVFYVFLGYVIFSAGLQAQDCTLDIGGDNTDMMIEVFQLSGKQIKTMENLKSDLEIQTKSLKEDIQKLFNDHPQSSTEELQVLADKYRVLEQKIMDASWECDKKLLTTFNEKQYRRYLDLCHEAFRKPIKIIPVAVKDTVGSN
jgi:Skp family chaperone for outer membrane proteins